MLKLRRFFAVEVLIVCSEYSLLASLNPSCDFEGEPEASATYSLRELYHSFSKFFHANPVVLDGYFSCLQLFQFIFCVDVLLQPCPPPGTRFLFCIVHAHNHVLTRSKRSPHNSRSWSTLSVMVASTPGPATPRALALVLELPLSLSGLILFPPYLSRRLFALSSSPSNSLPYW